MNAMDTRKLNIATKINRSFCYACLSTDRKLSPIGEYIDILRTISDDISNNVYQSLFCWECVAILKKIKDFKRKIEKAESVLYYYIEDNQKSLLKTLSTLTKTYTEDTIIFNHDDIADDDKKEIEIKIEIDNVFEDSHHTDDVKEEDNLDSVTNDLNLKEIKNEKPKEIKNEKPKETNNEKPKEINNEKPKPIEKENPKERKYKKNKVSHYRIISKRFTSKRDNAIECMCGLIFDTIKKFEAHVKTHTCVQCVYCEAEFLNISSFKRHYRSLHTVFVCDHCGKRCGSKHVIEKHMRRHITSHPCDSCPRVYKSLASLRSHRALKHAASPAERAYCVACNAHYRSAHEYARHVRTCVKHARETSTTLNKTFPCPECPNVYSRRTYMMNHYRHKHTNQSKHYCSQCDKHFLNRTKYVDHMRYFHEGAQREKNKLCNICGKGFAATRTLENHIRTHSGERPFECPHCSAKFTQKTSMLSHVKHIHMLAKRKPQCE